MPSFCHPVLQLPIKLKAEASVLGHKVGDKIALTAADFKKLSDKYFDEIEKKFK